MPGLTVFTGNRLEELSEELAKILRHRPPSPLRGDVFVTQTLGMQKWLSLRLAEALGVFANFTFLRPHQFLVSVFEEPLGLPLRENPFQSRFLPLAVFNHLSEALVGEETPPEYAPLAAYVRGEPYRLYRLSCMAADALDQYMVYREDLLREWSAGRSRYADGPKAEAERWQQRLWVELQERYPDFPDRVRIKEEIARALEGPVPPPGLPDRVFLFGISVLPSTYLDILRAMARHVEVHLFVPFPSPHYRFGAEEEGAASLLGTPAERDGSGPGATEGRGADRGGGNHFFLKGLGKVAADFLSLLAAGPLRPEPRFVPPPPGAESLLASLQRHIYENRWVEAPEPAREACWETPSIQVVSCHSEMREIEVLYEHLTELFNRDPGLEPRDVVVMSPRIEPYVPHIREVFDARAVRRPDSNVPPIPYAIADLGERHANPYAIALRALLDLLRSDFEAPAVVALLKTRPIAEKFRITQDDAETIESWVEDAAVRWGIDADFRRRLDLPPFERWSFRFGLDRILLGYMMSAGEGRLYRPTGRRDPSAPLEGNPAIVPLHGISPARGTTLGKFHAFLEALFAAYRHVTEGDGPSGGKTLEEWARFFSGLVEDFLHAPPEEEVSRLRLQTAADVLARRQRTCRLDRPVEFAVALSEFLPLLESEENIQGFLSGGVTFCTMIPLRSLPFRVVCLLGMNSGVFPRPQKARDFDLIAFDPRKGDRIPVEYDRHLFLETVLAAREHLYVSYRGRNVKDNTEEQPSPLVSVLLDYLDKSFRLTVGDEPVPGPVSAAIRSDHPLQPFSPRYFTGEDGRLFSYCREDREIAEMLLAGMPPRIRRLYREELGAPAEPGIPETILLDELIDLFRRPARFFVQRVLEARIPETRGGLRETEPLEIDALDAYRHRLGLLEAALRRGDAVEPEDLVRTQETLLGATGDLPFGAAGTQGLRRTLAEATLLLQGIREEVRQWEPCRRRLEIRIDRVRAVARDFDYYVAGAGTYKLVSYAPSEPKPRDRIRAWIRHLFATVALGETRTVHLGIKKRRVITGIRLPPLSREEAASHLNRLSGLFGEGWRRVLLFEPATSEQIAGDYLDAGAPELEDYLSGLDDLKRFRWLTLFEEAMFGDRSGSEGDPYMRLLFADHDLFSGRTSREGEEDLRRFVENALTVFVPMLEGAEG